MPLPLLTKQRLLAAKAEATPGTAESLTTAEATMNIYDHALAYESGWNERPGQSALSSLPGVPGARSGTATFKSWLVGKGASGQPTYVDSLMVACGMVNTSGSVALSTGSATAKTATVGLYQDGRLKTIAGAMGDFVMTGTAGNPVEIAWTFKGKYAAPTATAILAPTYETAIPPRFASATLTIGGTSFKLGEFELGLGNVLALIEDETDATGYHLCAITDRKPYFKCNPLALALGTKDWSADFVAGTEAALVLVVGAAANNIMTITAPKMQLKAPPQDGDTEGVLLDTLEFQLNRSAAAGDDEALIVFT